MGTTYRMPTLASRREYFRLPYPISTNAVLVVDGTPFKVDEVSEHGLRIVSGVGRLAVGAQFEGTLTLTMGLRCGVTGRVLRIDDNSFVVQLDRGPTCYALMREQRHVSKNYPDWKPQPV